MASPAIRPHAATSGVPLPRQKLRTLQWNKLPTGKVVGHRNLWTVSAAAFKSPTGALAINFDEMERLFAVSVASVTNAETKDVAIDRKKKSDEINLLESKRSLNVNIFLRQFRVSHTEIIAYLWLATPATISSSSPGYGAAAVGNGDSGGPAVEMSAERLRGLQRILPETDEVEVLRLFHGDVSRLGSAEKFYLDLIQLPDYRFRVESLLVATEFDQTFESIKPTIDAIIVTAKDLLENNLLRELIYIILTAGNFLNSGCYAGDAVGFKLASLLKLTDTGANKPGFTLLHFIALTAAQKNRQLLALPGQLKYIKEAAQFTVESLTSDVATLSSKVKSISDQMPSISSKEFVHNLKTFTKRAKKGIAILESDLGELEKIRKQLADFFCEELKTFKLDDCIKTFYEFFEKFHKAIQDNEQQSIAEEKAALRKKQSEVLKQKFSAGESVNGLQRVSTTSADDASANIDQTFVDPHRQSFMRSASNVSNSNRSERPRSGEGILDDVDGLGGGGGGDKRARRSTYRVAGNDLMDYLHTAAPTTNEAAASAQNSDFDRVGSLRAKRRPRLSMDFADSRERWNAIPPPILPKKEDGDTSIMSGLARGRTSLAGSTSETHRELATIDRNTTSLQKVQKRHQLPIPLDTCGEQNAQVDQTGDNTGTSDQAAKNAITGNMPDNAGTVMSVADRRLSYSDRFRDSKSLQVVPDVNRHRNTRLKSSDELPADNDIIERLRRRLTSSYDVDHTIMEVEEAGRDIDKIMSGSENSSVKTVSSVPTDARIKTGGKFDGISTLQAVANVAVEATQSALVAGERSPRSSSGNGGSGGGSSETRRWGRVFDVDIADDAETSQTMSRSILPCRQRDNCTKPACIDESVAESNSTVDEDVIANANQSSNSPRHQTSNIKTVGLSQHSTVQNSREPGFMQTWPDEMRKTKNRASADSSRFDSESVSSSSRDEGFESAVDGSQSDRSSMSRISTASSSVSSELASAATWPSTINSLDDISEARERYAQQLTPSVPLCDAEETESPGSFLFARSIDSLILPKQEMTLTSAEIDIDDVHAAGEMDSFSHNDLTLIESTGNQREVIDKRQSLQPQSTKSAGKSFLFARLSRPKKSSLFHVGKAVAPSARASEPKSKEIKAMQSPKHSSVSHATGSSGHHSSDSPFSRNTPTRATMPASLLNAKKKKVPTATLR